MDSKCQIGSISGAAVKRKLTWQTDPNQDLTSVIFCAVGKSMIDWIILDVGSIPESLIITKVVTNYFFHPLTVPGTNCNKPQCDIHIVLASLEKM